MAPIQKRPETILQPFKSKDIIKEIFNLELLPSELRIAAMIRTSIISESN